MTDSIRGLPVVYCEPYEARLTESACVSRWQVANHNVANNLGRLRKQARAIQLRIAHCAGCSVGAKRAKAAQAAPRMPKDNGESPRFVPPKKRRK
ncbi:MAG: hypothetical protein AAF368_00085 [Planctomycetota bacterium]